MGLTATLPFDLLPLPVAQAPTGPRWLAVHLPAFRLERCGWGPDELVVLGAHRRNAPRVVALTPAAREAGLSEGLTLAEARALVPGLRVEPLDEPGEAADRRDLVRAFQILGDRVEVDGDDGVRLEVSSTSARLGGEATLLRQARARADELGHRCHLAVADHPRAARALARHGAGDVVVPPGEGASALAGLPLVALEPGPVLAEALSALGLRTVGAWAALDAASVAGRFGAEGVELHRVARGLPGAPWAELAGPAPIEPVRVTLDDEAHDVAALVRPLAEGLGRLRDALAARDRVLVRLEARLALAWGAVDPWQRLAVRVASPTRDPELLARLVRSRLERTRLLAPVEAIELRAAEIAPDGGGQRDLLARREAAGAWTELLARLGDVLGEDAVVEAVGREAWAPEEAWVARPVHDDGEVAGVDACDDDPVEAQGAHGWHDARPRPTLLRAPPLPLRARAEAGRPVAVQGRHGWRLVRRARGPERLSGGWWRPDGGFDRAYWVVELPEGTAWLFEERGQWFLHGWFD